jgi:hypothetical protein
MNLPSNLILNPEIPKIWEFSPEDTYLEMRKTLFNEYIPLLDNHYDKEYSFRVGLSTFSLPGELIKNAYYHGDSKRYGTTLGIFLSPDAFVIGCNDGGDYFKKSEIKEVWEKRLPISSEGDYMEEGRKLSGHNVGHDFIFALTDEIFIDNASGTFFGKCNLATYLNKIQ